MPFAQSQWTFAVVIGLTVVECYGAFVDRLKPVVTLKWRLLCVRHALPAFRACHPTADGDTPPPLRIQGQALLDVS